MVAGIFCKIRTINPDFVLQNRFYDHIIRNEKSFIKITKYIKNNPVKWRYDALNVEEKINEG